MSEDIEQRALRRLFEAYKLVADDLANEPDHDVGLLARLELRRRAVAAEYRDNAIKASTTAPKV